MQNNGGRARRRFSEPHGEEKVTAKVVVLSICRQEAMSQNTRQKFQSSCKMLGVEGSHQTGIGGNRRYGGR